MLTITFLVVLSFTAYLPPSAATPDPPLPHTSLDGYLPPAPVDFFVGGNIGVVRGEVATRTATDAAGVYTHNGSVAAAAHALRLALAEGYDMLIVESACLQIPEAMAGSTVVICKESPDPDFLVAVRGGPAVSFSKQLAATNAEGPGGTVYSASVHGEGDDLRARIVPERISSGEAEKTSVLVTVLAPRSAAGRYPRWRQLVVRWTAGADTVAAEWKVVVKIK